MITKNYYACLTINKMFKTIKSKLLVLFLLVGIIPIGIVSIIEYRSAVNTLQDKAFNQLNSIRNIKRDNIETYFGQLKSEIKSLADNPITLQAFKELRTGFHQIGTQQPTQNQEQVLAQFYREQFIPRLADKILNNKEARFSKIDIEALFPKTDNKAIILQSAYITKLSNQQAAIPYASIHQKYHSFFANFRATFNYYDIFLIDNETGHIIYSVVKETDFATNLLDGPYSHTNIAKLFQSLRVSKDQAIRFYDFDFYEPSYLDPAMFMGVPLFDGEKNIATLMVQVPIDEIDRVMTGNKQWEKEGFGETGECYIVGSDYKMRNNSRFMIQDPKKFYERVKKYSADTLTIEMMKKHQTTILLQTINTESVKNALQGQENHKIIKDYRGELVLSAYTPLKISDINWVLISEIDNTEAFKSINDAVKRTITTLSILLLLIVIIAVLIASGVSKPILQLLQGTIDISRGKFDKPIQIDSNDEIGRLATSFNVMVKILKQSREKILTANAELKKQQEDLKIQSELLKQNNEELQTTEEELKQNLEELMTIQEKLERSEIELRGRLDAINRTLAVLECDVEGKILDTNTLFLHLIKYEKQEVINNNHVLVMGKLFEPTRTYQQFWKDLRSGIPQSGEFKIYNRYQQEVWINATYTPVTDEKGEIVKVIMLASDITPQKIKAIEFEANQRAFYKFNSIAELDLLGYVLNVNYNFSRLLHYNSVQDVEGKHIKQFYKNGLVGDTPFQDFWESLITAGTSSAEAEFVTKNKQLIWLAVSYNIVENQDGKPIKVILLAKDITKQKIQELTIQEQLDKIIASEEELRQNQDVLLQINDSLVKAQHELTISKEVAEIANQKMTDSIKYASRIQSAVFGNTDSINNKFTDAFILFKPRDVVSGDFYWLSEVGNKQIIVAADCTGHGVPGAFMSLVGNTLLSKIVGEYQITNPSEILMLLHIDIINSLKQNETTNKDGMDIAVCVIDYEREVLEFAGAKNPLYCIKKGNTIDTPEQEGTIYLKGDKHAIGGMTSESQHINFTTQTIPLAEIETCFIYSDGYEDQFGGAAGRKFLSKNFRRMLYEMRHFDMQQQKQLLDQTFAEWKGQNKQTDDILVIGFKPASLIKK
jgi:PAS domain S-box-containing protein